MEVQIGLVIVIGLLSIGVVMLARNNFSLQKTNTDVNSENIKLKEKLAKAVEENEEIMSIDPGDKAILPNYGLVYTARDESFKVDYEVEIIEVSEKKVKVNAVDFKPHCKIGRDTANKAGILAYMQDKWVDKKEMELIVDEATRRDAKLKKLGI